MQRTDAPHELFLPHNRPKMKIQRLLVVSIALLTLGACNAVRPYYEQSVKNWQNKSVDTSSPVVHTIYLIGDAGEPELDPLEPALASLQTHLEASDEHSTVVFLGDNIYPVGLPVHDPEEGEKSEERLIAEAKLKAQLDILKDFKGQPFFIAGNHDWNKSKSGGLERVIAQSEFVNAYLDNPNSFVPAAGCPGPVEVSLTDQLTLLLIDSEWFVFDWEKEPDMNSDCEILTREAFIGAFRAAVERHQDKDIIVAMHHPLYTQGSHGGYYRFKDHLFPLTAANDKLWIPLPVLGSIYPIYRQTGGVAEDVSHPKYQELKQGLLNAVADKKNVIFAAGHEHSLAYYNQHDHHFIVSGAGCKSSPVRKGKKAVFAHAATGYAKVEYHQDGTMWMEFWEPLDGKIEGQMVFRHKLRGPKPPVPVPEEKTYGEPSISSFTTPGFDQYEAGGFKKFMLGTHYRAEWMSHFQVDAINLREEYGGLVPVQRGGGFQTKSLRLENPDGQQYVLRSINKSVATVVPKFLDDTFAEDIMQDQTSNAHPYGALAVPLLAEAAGIYHTNPRIIWLPPQDALGKYAELFGNDLYLYEERPAGDRSDVASFGRSENIINFRKLIKRTQKNYDHLVDQEWTAKSRMFDLLINDWDRHDDQWRWATFEIDGKTIYRPIPRDRDQAFHHKFSGVLPILSQTQWALRKFQSFQPNVKSIKGLSFNGRFFDRAFMNELTREDFKNVAQGIQRGVTDAVIDSAFHNFPEAIYALNGDRFGQILKQRRDRLDEFADRFYTLLAKKVDVVGTKKNDFFSVDRLENGNVRVRVYERDHGKKMGTPWYDRTFVKSETKEIRLYGLKGKDEFKIKGESSKSILVRVIGGKSSDKVDDHSKVSGLGKKTKVYDASTGIRINAEATEAKLIPAD
ncbi:MAG: metallophosphoesterase, partial [Bacteroidota bacterium]